MPHPQDTHIAAGADALSAAKDNETPAMARLSGNFVSAMPAEWRSSKLH